MAIDINTPVNNLKSVAEGLNVTTSDPIKNAYQATDYQLTELDLLGVKFGSVSLMNFYIEFNYFEDIYNHSASGKVVISDAHGLLKRGAINGSEILQVKFVGAAGGKSSYKSFNVYSISDRHFDINSNFEAYTLNFCSEDFMLSQRYRLSKSYKKKKISEITKDILDNVLKTDKSYDIEDTSGVYDFVIPNKKILDSINWLSSYALPNNGKTGADMLFFENSEGYNLKSLQTLFKQEPIKTYRFNPKNVLLNDNRMSSMNDNIYRLELINSFDVLDASLKGTFNNRLVTVDPLLRQKNYQDFNYNDYFNTSEKLNKYPVLDIDNLPYIDRFGKKLYDSPPEDLNTGALRVMVTNSQQSENDYVKGKDQVVSNDYFIEKYLPNRMAQLSLSNYIKIKIIVPGNTEILAGKVLNISVLGVDIISSQESRKDDDTISGNYLVTAVRHIINASRYISVVELAKETKTNVQQ